MIPYIGGKSYLAGWIIDQFPENYKEMTYCEVFGGGGWVLFRKEPSYVEIYNDLNSNLTTLFKVIRDNYKKFEHRAQWSLHSREMYLEAREKLKNDKFISQVEKSMHIAIEQVQSFSGKGGWGYQVTAQKIASGKWMPFLKRLQYINARLKKVQIECLDFEKIITKYDRETTLFYLDPPYVDVEHYYNSDEVCFTLDDHKRLAGLLKKIKGKFVLSYYDHELVRSLYKKYKMLHKETSKHSCGVTRNSKTKTKPRGKEVLVMNFK